MHCVEMSSPLFSDIQRSVEEWVEPFLHYPIDLDEIQRRNNFTFYRNYLQNVRRSLFYQGFLYCHWIGIIW